jgi:hypothetical protein
MVRLGTLVPVKGNLNPTGPFLFQHDNAPVHKVRSLQKLFFKIGVEELDLPAESPDLNPIEHI